MSKQMNLGPLWIIFFGLNGLHPSDSDSLDSKSNPGLFTNHTSSVKRFSENFDLEAVTYLIFFVGTHWFQKCNFWKNSLSPFWGRRGRWGQTTSKLKITKILNENPLKIDEIQNLASATSKMASVTSRSSKGAQWIFPKNTFFKSGHSTEKNEL